MAQPIEKTERHGEPYFWEQENWPEKRVLEHFEFYEKQTKYSEKIARLLDGAILVASASIPVVAATAIPKVVLAALGALVAVLSGMGHQFGWKENWARQNRVTMAINQELVWYRTGQSPYNGSRSQSEQALLALRVEDIAQADADTWSSRIERGVDVRGGKDHTKGQEGNVQE